jgi:hypothetical protein
MTFFKCVFAAMVAIVAAGTISAQDRERLALLEKKCVSRCERA